MVRAKKTNCRLCGQATLFEVIDLGDLPVANQLTLEVETLTQIPLRFSVCGDCCLGQIDDYVSSQYLFDDYRYLSSTSKTMLRHATNFVSSYLNTQNTSQQFVLEIASNDGYLLENFVGKVETILGVEPAKNVAMLARRKGVPTLNTYFSKETAYEILDNYGSPDLVVANNVAAHVPDIKDFFEGLRVLCGTNTLISIENPHLLSLLKETLYDTIYHEHFSYLSANAVDRICNSVGLELFNIEILNIHGESFRYWIKLPESSRDATRQTIVESIIRKEQNFNLNKRQPWMDFAARVYKSRSEFKNLIDSENQRNKSIYGFGAAAKASTLLNFASVNVDQIPIILDNGPEKLGRYLPNTSIPIFPPDFILSSPPDSVFVFPWNIRQEIMIQLRNTLGFKGNLYSLEPGSMLPIKL